MVTDAPLKAGPVSTPQLLIMKEDLVQEFTKLTLISSGSQFPGWLCWSCGFSIKTKSKISSLQCVSKWTLQKAQLIASPLPPSTSVFIIVADCSKHGGYSRDTGKGTSPAALRWPASCWPSDQGWPTLGHIPLVDTDWHHRASPSVHRVYTFSFWMDSLALLVFIPDKLYKPQLTHPNPPFHFFHSEKR